VNVGKGVSLVTVTESATVLIRALVSVSVRVSARVTISALMDVDKGLQA
jgi:hypothetical protein